MKVSQAQKWGGPSKAVRERRALRDAEQTERQAANRTAGGPTPWAARKEARRLRRLNDPSVQMQPRTLSGMIVLQNGLLKFDTVQARNEALVRMGQAGEEKAAVDLEKRKSSQKAKQARANRPKPGAVTVRKSNNSNKNRESR